MGIGHSQRECSPLYRGEVPTHTGEGRGKSDGMGQGKSNGMGQGKEEMFYLMMPSTHFIYGYAGATWATLSD